MIVIARGRFGPTPARILEQLRVQGALSREEIGRRTGLSGATVARTIAQLLDERLVQERPGLVPPGVVGRPRIPVALQTDTFAALGVHLGRTAATVALVDLAGRPVAQRRFPRPTGELGQVVAAVRSSASRLVAAAPERTVLAAGLVGPWDDLDLDAGAVARKLAGVTGLEVATADHVAAVAAAEYLARTRGRGGCTLYVYARDTVGFALAHDLPLRTEISRVGRLTHFPTGSEVSCRCGATGCLEATASDDALARRAHEAGASPAPGIDALLTAARSGSGTAEQMLLDRAMTLGRTAARVRDMVHPDRMVLVGQAFTGYPPALERVLAGFEATTTLPPLDVSFTRFGSGVQAAAAGAVALGPVFEDPLGAVRGEGGASARTALNG